MRKVAAVLVMAAVAGLVVSSAPKQANAQPQYLKAFLAKYEIEGAAEKKCGICHGEKKSERSAYAMEFGKALGEKKVKDVEKINAAYDTAAKAEYADGKTYGELLKSGKLPAPYGE
ncbi:MAG: hypothetical protein R3C01_08870 [Planctomycetaceae bacterium]